MSESLFGRYERGERSLYNFNGEIKKPNRWEETDRWNPARFDEYATRFLASLSVSENLSGRGDDVYTWP